MTEAAPPDALAADAAGDAAAGRGWGPGAIWWLGLVLVAVTVGVAALHVHRTHRRLTARRHQVDFAVFHRNAQVAAQGGDIYTTHRRERLYPYLYPPLLVSLLRPVAGLELGTATLLWNLLQLLLIPLGFELLRRLLAALEAPAPPLLAGAAVALGTWTFVDNIEWAQVNLVVWLCVIGALLALRRGRPALSGALVALAFSLKLVPLLLLLLVFALGWRRAGRWLGGFAAALVVCGLLLPGLVNGFGWTWRMNGVFGDLAVRTAFGGAEALPWGRNCANHSLLFALHHGFGQCAPRAVRVAPQTIAGLYLGLRLAVGLGTLATAVLLRWRSGRVAWSLAVAQLVLAMVLLNPITWIHHWVLVTVALGVLAGVPFQPRLGPRARLCAAALALALAAVTLAAPQLEAFRTGTLSVAHLGIWAGITALLLAEQLPALRRALTGWRLPWVRRPG